MIKKFIKAISKPYLIPEKIINTIRFNSLRKKYNLRTYQKDQNLRFNQSGLDREKGIFNLNQLKKKIQF